MKKIKIIFIYLESLWTGSDGRVSLRQASAIALIINFISNISYAVQKWDAGRSLESLSLILGIEAGLVVSLLGISALQSFSTDKLNATIGSSTTTTTEVETPTGTLVKTTERLPV